MKLHKLLIGTALTSSLLAAAGTLPAAADPINFGSYTGPVNLNFSNYESFLTPSGAVALNSGGSPTVAQVGGAPAVGSENFGIFAVTSVVSPGFGGQSFYNSLGNPVLLVGVFDGIIVKSVTGSGATETTTNTGGVFQLYSVSAAAFAAAGGDQQGLLGYANASCAIGSLCYNGITNIGTPVLTMTLTPGIDALDPTVTLTANLNASDVPPTGTAAFDGIVTGLGGLAPNVSAKDSFCPDVISTGCPGADVSTPGPTSWALASQDPITATAVPEPASLVLFGSGLLALAGMFGWRRRKSV